jgi:hypothetical protein
MREVRFDRFRVKTGTRRVRFSRFWEHVLGAKKGLAKINNRKNRENRKGAGLRVWSAGDVPGSGSLTGERGLERPGKSCVQGPARRPRSGSGRRRPSVGPRVRMRRAVDRPLGDSSAMSESRGPVAGSCPKLPSSQAAQNGIQFRKRRRTVA